MVSISYGIAQGNCFLVRECLKRKCSPLFIKIFIPLMIRYDRAPRVRVKRGNMPLIDVCSFKALSCRVSCFGVLTNQPRPLLRLGNSI